MELEPFTEVNSKTMKLMIVFHQGCKIYSFRYTKLWPIQWYHTLQTHGRWKDFPGVKL